MKRVTFKILFIAKLSRAKKNGEVPVLLRVTVNGQRAETYINLWVKSQNWNSIAEKLIGDTSEDIEINLRLDTIRMRIMQIYREMEFDREEITARKIIDRYTGRNQAPVITLLDVFRDHNERCHKLAGKDMAPATVTRHPGSEREVHDYIMNMPDSLEVPDICYQMALIRRDDMALIGDMGIIFSNHNNLQAEIGCTLSQDYQGKGYATQAMTVMVGYLFNTLEKHRIVLSIDPRNTPSARLAERLGSTKETHLRESYYVRGSGQMM